MRGAFVAGALLVVPAIGVALAQPRLARTVHDTKNREDVYVLPRPSDLKIADLGYDAAAVDLLWAKLIVEYGTHIVERRDFHPDPYIDAITFLEPAYPLVYRFADTLLCYRPIRGTEADARKAREVLELGTRARPGDHDVWLHYGQFIAFLAPSFLHDKEEIDRWRHDGALALMRAVELGAEPDRAVSAATILNRSGETRAAIEALERTLAVTDDPQTRAEIEAKLARLRDNAEADATQAAIKKTEAAIGNEWRARYPFLSRGTLLLVGPSYDAAKCAGLDAANDAACGHDWDAIIHSAAR